MELGSLQSQQLKQQPASDDKGQLSAAVEGGVMDRTADNVASGPSSAGGDNGGAGATLQQQHQQQHAVLRHLPADVALSLRLLGLAGTAVRRDAAAHHHTAPEDIPADHDVQRQIHTAFHMLRMHR